jgi:hypothetical protein
VDDRIAELPQLSYHWQAEFPLLDEEAIGVASPVRVSGSQFVAEGAWGDQNGATTSGTEDIQGEDMLNMGL